MKDGSKGSLSMGSCEEYGKEKARAHHYPEWESQKLPGVNLNAVYPLSGGKHLPLRQTQTYLRTSRTSVHSSLEPRLLSGVKGCEVRGHIVCSHRQGREVSEVFTSRHTVLKAEAASAQAEGTFLEQHTDAGTALAFPNLTKDAVNPNVWSRTCPELPPRS